MRLEWRQSQVVPNNWYYQLPTQNGGRIFGGATAKGWSDDMGQRNGQERSVKANKAACEASVKQSIRELAAWVEQEEQA